MCCLLREADFYCRRSYLVRWVEVEEEHTIFFNIEPQKKSINFGIFKHPGHGSAPTPRFPSLTFEPPPTPGMRRSEMPNESHTSRTASSTATEKLKSIGLKPVSWYGVCDANKVSTGKHDVRKGEGGMYALVFDNTFAKQLSKSVIFVLLTYPTSSPPRSSHHTHHIQETSTGTATGRRDRSAQSVLRHDSSESIQRNGSSTWAGLNGCIESRLQDLEETGNNVDSSFFTGVLQKRRRKRHQGYARRFFSLDYKTSTLSYYHNRNTLALRGAVPLSLAAIGANAATRQISIDSGAEVWHLKASNQKDFEAWKNALELARTHSNSALATFGSQPNVPGSRQSLARLNTGEGYEWAKIETLANRLQGSRDVARTIAQKTDPKHAPPATLKPTNSDLVSMTSSASESPPEQPLNNGYFQDGERRPFWKRKPSSERTMPGMFKRSFSSQPPTPSGTSNTLHSKPASLTPESGILASHQEESLHDHCMALLRDLDSIVADFAILIEESKLRHFPVPVSAVSRYSMDSQGTQEFFDADGGSASQFLAIHQETDDESEPSANGLANDEDDLGSASDLEGPASGDRSKETPESATSAFPSTPKSLSPLPISQTIKRRTTVPPPAVSPPSLIGFLRKNVGKDLSTISMPVSANEPLSLLQRAAEQLEYSTLLDEAANPSKKSVDRLLYITAFAISTLSAARVKERAIRKPFNPMLGETFELVREDRGFRFLVEKVSHRPVRMACHADAEAWSFAQSPLPTQKFWGKSAELITEGRVRITLHKTGDRFSFTPATSFLRNIIAGEKYIEPVGSMTVTNETTGEHATVTFKPGGMFSGRSEDVAAQTFSATGDELPQGLLGKWTSSLSLTSASNPSSSEPPIWTASALRPETSKRYGLTLFAASLNEITALEAQNLPPTDSRLRPDQRALEENEFERAEELKARLEEAQRRRRKDMEEQGREWTPRFFARVDGVGEVGEEVWRLRGGREGYWEERSRRGWDGVERIFDV